MQEHKAMMSDKEVEIIESLLKPEFDCLEFGSGYSTVYFPQFVSSWTAIEHDEDWFFKVLNMREFNRLNTKIILSDTNHYVGQAINLDKKFDFILIDGENREQCLDFSFSMLKPNGVILLHDASRFEYASWINKFDGEILCEGEMPDERVPGYYLIRGLKLWRS